ncbi:hypothetical protein [Streptomyces sp. NPDC093093]|uniref:hypothetical protein n=1 Tax=Streptomyces sp. NPDC093093 TaxID=3366025 RepID=UPI00380110AC
MSRTLMAGAALIALASLTGCGGDGDAQVDAGIGSQPGGKDESGGKSLPKAKDVAAMERFVSQYTVCNDLETDATLGQYSETASEFKDLPKGAEAGVKERAYCKAERAQPIALLTISDMKKFLQALKTDDDAGALVGADFAVVPTDDGTTRALASSGLLVASCNADFNSKIPSGYTKRESGVEGCVMTDYVSS